MYSGAEGRGRTGTKFPPSVFETDASANSATSATALIYYHFQDIESSREFR